MAIMMHLQAEGAFVCWEPADYLSPVKIRRVTATSARTQSQNPVTIK